MVSSGALIANPSQDSADNGVDDECLFCYGRCDPVQLLPCSHANPWCYRCVVKELSFRTKCPLCRTAISRVLCRGQEWRLTKSDDPIYHAYEVLEHCEMRYNAENQAHLINRFSVSKIEDLVNLYRDNMPDYFGMEEEWALRVVKRFEGEAGRAE